MEVNFELYKVFYHVGKTLSFSEASNKLFVSQSAVSQSIKALEEKMGCKLLFRNTKQVRLTREGTALFEYIEQAFNFIKAGERNIADIHSLVRGEIRIGASDTICKYYLLPYFKEFNRVYPGVKLHITNRTSPKCLELLTKGSVDFIVVNIPQGFTCKGMDVHDIRPVQDVFIAGKSFEHLKGRKLSLKSLEDYPVLVLEKDTTTRGFFDRLMVKYGVNIVPEVELGSIDLLVEMARIGLGISFVVTDSIDIPLKNGDVFTLDIEEAIPGRNLGIINHSHMPLPVAARKFIELLGA